MQVSSGTNTKQAQMPYLVGGQWDCRWPRAGWTMTRISGGDFSWPRAGWTRNRNQGESVSGGEL